MTERNASVTSDLSLAYISPAYMSTITHTAIDILQEPKSHDPRVTSIIESRIKYHKKWFWWNSVLLVLFSICVIVLGIAGFFQTGSTSGGSGVTLIIGSICLILVGVIIYPFRFWFQWKRLLQRIKLLENPLIVWKLDTVTWHQYMEYLHHDSRTKQRFFLNIGQQNSCIRCICRTSYTKAIDRSGGYIILFEQCLMIDDIYAKDFVPLSQPLTIIEVANDTNIVRVKFAHTRFYFDLMVPRELERNDLNRKMDEVNLELQQKLEERNKQSICSCENIIDHFGEFLMLLSDFMSSLGQ